MKNEETVKLETSGSRRRFIKTAATASAFSILPAQSVWGACTISGAVSGNQSRVNAQCTFPNISGGRSPGTWKKFVPGASLNKANKKTKAIFHNVAVAKDTYGGSSQTYKDIRNCYRDWLLDIVANDELISSDTLQFAASMNPSLSGLPSSMSVEEGLLSNGAGFNNIFYHVAAGYMNAYVGMYASYPAGEASAIAVANEIFTYWVFENSHSGPSNTDVSSLMMYDNGVTMYTHHECAVYYP